MCGISGIFAFTEQGRQYLSQIGASTQSLISRGPDSGGTFVKKNVALGHRRLSIIDTSNAAAQPFTDSSGRYTLVFNGEIFNYKELREKLKQKGCAFRSESDTEVLLQLYILEKEKCLERLDGEFAFAIYDHTGESIFLARDRFGIKPLYFYHSPDAFIFASELKAIVAFGIKFHLDRASLLTYLQLNYIPAPDSIYEEVKKAGAGEYITVDASGKIKHQTYYTIPFAQLQGNTDYTTATNRLKTLLENSVKARMIADVPLGAFLSGGVDSSIITAIAAQQVSHLNTFSIGYRDEPLFDETKYAELLSRKYNTEHTVFRLSNDDLFANLYTVLDYLDEPFADSSALAVNILSMHTRKQVRVALSGDGADELFGGYNKHEAELKARKKGLVSRLVKGSGALLEQLPKSRNSKSGNTLRQLQKFSEGMKLDEKERYWRWAGFSSEEQAEKLLLGASLTREYSDRKKNILRNLGSDYNSVLLTDTQLVLQNDMLVKADRMSMCHGLELRIPFLDHRLVDFAFSLPSEYKIDGKERKKILKEAFRDELPAEILKRKKQGFEVPLLRWFKTDLESTIREDLLGEEFLREQGIFNGEEIEKIKRQLFSASPNDSVSVVWGLIVFQYWWKKNKSHLHL
jgi:asparagine synthase (glutamine-hydrolysing)